MPQVESQSSANIPCGMDAEMSDMGLQSETLDNQNASISPKCPNEDTNLTPQKKKRKKKKKKAGITVGPSSLTSDISLTGKEEKMDEGQSSDSDESSCTAHDMQKSAESSSHLSKAEKESTGNVSASSLDAAKGQSVESCAAPGLTQELSSTCPAKACPPPDQPTEKVDHEKKGQTSTTTGAQTPVDQNANMKSSTGSQREADAEEQKNQISSGHSPVKLEQSQKQQSTRSAKKKTESEKHKETGQDTSQKYATRFEEI
ncbi:hypothetical protein E1301_Tti019682 [Triplophysa tibetana]|uniref:Uncharacterized protein n=1 Tax=Triplophysa tibetana TaxID=1572043 RepID=A0A5A9PFD6_9TELE|nr:hypothetical protein E1301_Tti019682 [Triplophysa tibetana]